MKKTLFSSILTVFISTFLSAQVLITPSSQSLNSNLVQANTLINQGNGILVKEKYTVSVALPAPTVTMACPGPGPTLTSEVGRLQDPSGTGSYLPNNTYNCSALIDVSGVVGADGIRIVFEEMDLGGNLDRVEIKSFDNLTTYKEFYGQYHQVFLSNDVKQVRINFITDDDASVGAGFRIRWEAVFNTDSDIIAEIGSGNLMVFQVGNNVFRAGSFKTSNLTNVGNGSTAFGYNNEASGDYSFVSGVNSKAQGYTSNALGNENTVAGGYSTAIGNYNTIAFSNSFAIGNYNNVTNSEAFAIGSFLNASHSGSFLVGDEKTGATALNSDIKNRFSARFRNGYKLFTNVTNTIGVQVVGGGNSWSALSDSTKKEKLLAINGQEILEKITDFKLTTWNYKGQDEKIFRHYGPMAQDFFNAFGKDAIGTIGCDTLINQQDFLGVSFVAIQALIHENNELKNKNISLEARLKNLEGIMKEMIENKKVFAKKEQP